MMRRDGLPGSEHRKKLLYDLGGYLSFRVVLSYLQATTSTICYLQTRLWVRTPLDVLFVVVPHAYTCFSCGYVKACNMVMNPSHVLFG